MGIPEESFFFFDFFLVKFDIIKMKTKKKILYLGNHTRDVDSLEGVPDIDSAYAPPKYMKERDKEIQRVNFQYHHYIVGFLMSVYDENWENSRSLFAENSEKIFKIVNRYKKFPQHNPALVLNLVRKVQAELNYIPKK